MRLFERGIDPHSAAAAAACTPAAWPDPARIAAYRAEARARVRSRPRLKRATPMTLWLRLRVSISCSSTGSYRTAVHAGRARRGVKTSTLAPGLVTGPGPDMEIVAIPAGTVTLGAHFDALPFGWDNEFPSTGCPCPLRHRPVPGHRRAVPGVRGRWVRRRSPVVGRRLGVVPPLRQAHPWRWLQDPDGTWWHRTLHGRVPLDDVGGWPALVTAAEAAAFCAWTDARLPSEAELHRPPRRTPARSPLALGRHPSGPAHGNFGHRHDNPVPVQHHPAGDNSGSLDLLGSRSGWTSTPFLPQPGFSPWARTYAGYSPTSSTATTGCSSAARGP